MLSQQMTKVAIHLMNSLDNPVATRVADAIRRKDWNEIISTSVHPNSYQEPGAYFRAVAAADFLRKYRGFELGGNLRKKAVATFLQCEQENRRSNDRLRRYVSWFKDGFVGDTVDLKLYDFLSELRGEVRELLGGLPRELWPKFGPGSTYHDRGEAITIPHKMSARASKTPNLWWGDLMIHRTAWGRSNLQANKRSAFRTVRGNRFTTVPKDSSKDRGICIEPSVNVSLQLAVGTHISRCLAERGGLVKESSQERHKELARLASVHGHLATIDLSNASDTVCYQLVKLLLPEMWFDLLDDLRSPFTQLDGRWYKLEKFSSMGNGFTFELETLLFFAMARVTARSVGASLEDVTAYGDDIIVPTEAAKPLLALLTLLGFTPNAKKTFIEGPFRESCGGDFFRGVDVRPFYLKEEPYDPATWIALANGIRRLAHKDGCLGDRPIDMLKPWFMVLGNIPSDIRRIRGPMDLGDAVIWDNPETWQTRCHPSGHRWIRTYQPVVRRVKLAKFHPEVQLASALYGVPSSGAAVRDGISGYRKKWSVLSDATSRLVFQT